MSNDGSRPEGDRDGAEPQVTQWARADHGGRVQQAGRDQHIQIFNLGNAAWVTVPVVVVVAVALVLYLTVGPAPHASGSPAPRAAAAKPGRPPLTVTLAYDQHNVDNGAGSCVTWIFDRPLRAIPAAPGGLVNETWARRFGGVDVGVTNFKLAVQGVTKTAVQLLGFRVIDVERGPVIRGTDVVSSAGCGPSPDAGFEIALGTKPPAITPVPGLDSGAAKKIPFPFVVSSSDIQQFQVQARESMKPEAKPCNCEIKWRLALDWSYEGKTGTTVIDDNGKPFQTAFPALQTSAPWFDENGVWKRV